MGQFHILVLVVTAAALTGCLDGGYRNATELLEDVVVCVEEPTTPATGTVDSAMCLTDEGGVVATIADSQDEAEDFISGFVGDPSYYVVSDLDRTFVVAPTERRAQAVAERLDGRIIRSLSDLRS